MSRSRSADGVILRDSTLREGLDTPQVEFSLDQRLRIGEALADSRVPEAEVVAPSRVLEDLRVALRLKETGIRTSGLIYSQKPSWRRELEEATRWLDHIDLLMPLSPKREPRDWKTKREILCGAVSEARERHSDVGVGFPHATQTDEQFLLEVAENAVELGAGRVTLYDTNGGSDPPAVSALVARVTERLAVPLFFHGHNDLGLATANSLAAVAAGAKGLDVTVNGLGDRAGNASLEQVALGLRLRGVHTGVALERLRGLSETVARESGVPVSKLAPVVGEFVLWHRSPSHLDHPDLFEAFEPGLIGAERKLEKG